MQSAATTIAYTMIGTSSSEVRQALKKVVRARQTAPALKVRRTPAQTSHEARVLSGASLRTSWSVGVLEVTSVAE